MSAGFTPCLADFHSYSRVHRLWWPVNARVRNLCSAAGKGAGIFDTSECRQRTIVLQEIADATRLSKMHVYRLIEKYYPTSSPPPSS